jgi:hypothetical protein
MIAFFTGANLLGRPMWETITMDDANDEKVATLSTLFCLDREQVRKYLTEKQQI